MPGQCQGWEPGVLVSRQESLGRPHPPVAEVTFQSQPAALFMASTALKPNPTAPVPSSSLRTVFPKAEGGGWGWKPAPAAVRHHGGAAHSHLSRALPSPSTAQPPSACHRRRPFRALGSPPPSQSLHLPQALAILPRGQPGPCASLPTAPRACSGQVPGLQGLTAQAPPWHPTWGSPVIHDTPVRPTPLPPACASRPAEVWPPPHLPHRASPPQTAGSPVSGRPLGLGWGGGGHWLGASEGACHSTPTNRAGRDPSRTRASGRTGTCGEPPPCHPPRSALPQPRRSPNV